MYLTVCVVDCTGLAIGTDLWRETHCTVCVHVSKFVACRLVFHCGAKHMQPPATLPNRNLDKPHRARHHWCKKGFNSGISTCTTVQSCQCSNSLTCNQQRARTHSTKDIMLAANKHAPPTTKHAPPTTRLVKCDASAEHAVAVAVDRHACRRIDMCKT